MESGEEETANKRGAEKKRQQCFSPVCWPKPLWHCEAFWIPMETKINMFAWNAFINTL